MTLKQKLFLKKLPENNYNMSKTMKEVGYSKVSARAGSQYRSLRRLTKLKEIYDIEGIKSLQFKAFKRFEKEKDNSNVQRAIEHMGIIAGVKRVSEVDNKNAEKIIIAYGTRPTSLNNGEPVDNKNTESIDRK